MKGYQLLILCGLAAGLFGCKTVMTTAGPGSVRFHSAALYPEGVDWDAHNQRFLVTSIRKGEIGSVKDDGTYWVFAKDPRMVSAVGIKIDAPRDRVLVCNADPGAAEKSSPDTTGKLAGLAVFQLSSGKLLHYVDLAKGINGGHFCNDLTVAADGTVYVTDSFSPIIYKVDTAYRSSVLVSNDAFNGKSFNLNGIVERDGYLLVVKMNSGQLFKVPLNKPNAFHEVKLPGPIYGADGLGWGADGALMVIANNNAYVGATPPTATNKVIKLTSNDNWQTASVAGEADTGDVFATTGTLRDGQFYVVHAMLHVLFNPDTKQQLEQFAIVKYNP